MSVEREGREVTIECDHPTCKEKVDGWDNWPEARAKGWRAKQIGRDWIHSCPQHARELMR